MSAYVSTHALERSIRAMAPSKALELDAKRRAGGVDQLQELEHQFHVPISGTARAAGGWTKVQLHFDVAFVFAPEQRSSPLLVPHFTSGAVVSGEPSPDPAVPDPNNPDSLVAVACQVVDWARDLASDAIVGAIVGIGVSTLGGGDVDFSGYAHLTFQGYGATSEDIPTQLDTTGPTQ